MKGLRVKQKSVQSYLLEPAIQPETTALDFDTRYFSALESKPKQASFGIIKMYN